MKVLAGLAFLAAGPLHAQDPLLSWNDTTPKKAIVAFVEKVTKEGSPEFVKPEERIATFDNDGTLWVAAAPLQRPDRWRRPPEYNHPGYNYGAAAGRFSDQHHAWHPQACTCRDQPRTLTRTPYVDFKTKNGFQI